MRTWRPSGTVDAFADHRFRREPVLGGRSIAARNEARTLNVSALEFRPPRIREDERLHQPINRYGDL
jgi:hypothetical protein